MRTETGSRPCAALWLPTIGRDSGLPLNCLRSEAEALMGRSYLRLMTLAIACSSLAPLVTVVASVYLLKIHIPWLEVSFYLSSATALVLVSLGLGRSLKRYESQIEDAAAEQGTF